MPAKAQWPEDATQTEAMVGDGTTENAGPEAEELDSAEPGIGTWEDVEQGDGLAAPCVPEGRRRCQGNSTQNMARSFQGAQGFWLLPVKKLPSSSLPHTPTSSPRPLGTPDWGDYLERNTYKCL